MGLAEILTLTKFSHMTYSLSHLGAVLFVEAPLEFYFRATGECTKQILARHLALGLETFLCCP
jgi:hypothetical protein